MRVVLSSPMPDANYVVNSTARSTTGMVVEFSPISTTVFEIRTYSTSGVASDPTSIWFALYA